MARMYWRRTLLYGRWVCTRDELAIWNVCMYKRNTLLHIRHVCIIDEFCYMARVYVLEMNSAIWHVCTCIINEFCYTACVYV